MSSGPLSPRFLAVLPARGGSKRILRKNVRKFHGLPLVGRTIQTVLASKVFRDVIVSTDDAEIAHVARDYGALVPFVRPTFLSGDSTPTAPVIAHAVKEMLRSNATYDAVCCVYPGSVLMRPSDFRRSSHLVHMASGQDAVVAAVTRYGHPIQRALKLGSDGDLVPIQRGPIFERTQDLEPTWHDAGQFYWATPRRWNDPTPLLARVTPYELPAWRVQDIDTEDDWYRAELMFQALSATEFE